MYKDKQKYVKNSEAERFIYKTKDLSIFNSIEGNRIIKEGHVAKLKNSMLNKYLFSPIIVNEKLEVIDGQHRLRALKEIKKENEKSLPVYYIIVEGYNLPDVQKYNMNTSNWGYLDYAKSYAGLGNKHYKKCLEFYNKYGFGITLTIAMLKGNKSRLSGGYDKDNFCSGNFKIKNLKKAESLADKITSLKKYIDCYNKRSFALAMIKMLNKDRFNFNRFKNKLSYQANKLNYPSTTNQYLEVIEEIYNYKSRAKNKVRLYDYEDKI